MTTVIQGGSTGNTADVNKKNQLEVCAVSEARATLAALEGNAFLISTPVLALSSANKSSLLQISNTDIVQWVISRLVFSLTTSTGGVGAASVEILKNPTAGTLISAGVVTSAQNLDFGSPTELTSDIRTGVEGLTLTNGVELTEIVIPTVPSRTVLAGQAVVLSPGTQIGLSLTPPTGNTSMTAHIIIILHRITP